jgi:hypothetical protein
MKRLFALALIASLGLPSIAFAEGPISQAANKSVRETTATATESAKSEGISTGFASYASVAGVKPAASAAALAQQGGSGAISSTGMKKSTKMLIYAAVAGAFGGIAYGIDQKVKNVTPSSLGTRHDNDVFNK